MEYQGNSKREDIQQNQTKVEQTSKIHTIQFAELDVLASIKAAFGMTHGDFAVRNAFLELLLHSGCQARKLLKTSETQATRNHTTPNPGGPTPTKLPSTTKASIFLRPWFKTKGNRPQKRQLSKEMKPKANSDSTGNDRQGKATWDSTENLQ
ncbi:hypothetical protein CCACVL1_24789 [Corchorus capsularis]|uniref:Uncharacterized protein n=1 Tax=Corchorus capsularis TaxID=210143 RepID=A0A1R3GN53_COCAP|nr:hypothetical protein CCACVL1_24789 [Corchorus capsularis]